jgi:hypothetical protein
MELLEYSHRDGADLWILAIVAVNVIIYLLWILPASEENAAVEKWMLENNPDLNDPKKKEEIEKNLKDPATRAEAQKNINVRCDLRACDFLIY